MARGTAGTKKAAANKPKGATKPAPSKLKQATSRSERKSPEESVGSGRARTLKRAVFVIAAAVFVALSLSFPVRTWFAQQAEIDNLDQQMVELDSTIATLEADVAQRTSPEGARTKALCQGPFSAPGTEVYAVPGLNGCQHVP